MASDLELLTVGRISIDLYCDQVGAGWIEGWVTERGRAVHRSRFEGQA